ncbi:MAG: site-2 protease family protein [Candidatus Thalassarchaeaceae archaeon]|jgi:membrane-associated protease RseP (regulator of RpoE activity)|nr:site-2 protease family protein [Candidatus Thalassarchaeaceae archaeon]MDP6318502.1 site-2 protease family protein [Candidatus Thalassarchaeaceae archaeon]HJM29780.1 site-2 protease family protein [Candidatus Thalassarchaeaceae archaeon]HJN70493.1 site-2 protease family protein [Candidatus Thalassarchaeaceae archaeon]|tara:strand:- start:1184 stop:2692 length:1509 start_codon:yes stop_codon:yes gene_type:complete
MEQGLSLNQILFIALLGIFWINGWAPLWVVLLVSIWYLSLIWLEQNGTLDKWNATRALGIILMLRTNRGKGALENVSRPRRFWRWYGEFSIWLCLAVMIAVVALLFISAIVAAMEPSQQEVLPASDLLLIPGVTSFVPFWWPFLALIIALIIHEYSHGIQARAHGMQVRSFGLLLAGPLPVGAFAEPEYEEMMRAPRRERMRLYAAGPSINLLATWIVLILLSATATGFTSEVNGVHASAVIIDSGAEDAGLLPYETITHIDGFEIIDYDDFTGTLESYSAGESALFTVLPSPFDKENSEREIEIVFTDKHEHYMRPCLEESSCNAEEYSLLLEENGIHEGDAFVGMVVAEGSIAADRWSFVFRDDLSVGGKFGLTLLAPLNMLGIPIANDGHTMVLEERAMLSAGDGVIASTLGTDGMLAVFDFLFWLAWINFLLGFANLIPMVPFDGGHIVRDGTHSTLRFFMRKSDPIRIENLADRLSSMSSLFVLFVILIPIVLPRIF